MEDKERDEILYRLDERTKRVDDHLDRLERRISAVENITDNHESRISDNEDGIDDIKTVAKAGGSGALAMFGAIAAKLLGIIRI